MRYCFVGIWVSFCVKNVYINLSIFIDFLCLREVFISLTFSLQYNVAQSELDIYLSNQQNEQSKLNEMKRNLNKTTVTLKERQRLV